MVASTSLLILLLLHTQCNYSVQGANILAIDTLLSPSHYIFNDAYLLELVKRGHNVTILGHSKDKHGHPNYTHIVMEGVYERLNDSMNVMELTNLNSWELINIFWEFSELICVLDQQTEGLKKISNYPNDFKFDLVIWDFNTGQCYYPLIEKFGRPPIIATNPFINQPNIFKNVWQSYIPFMGYPYTDRMTFLQRLKSNFFILIFEITRIFKNLPRQKELAEQYFGKSNLTIEEVERNVSIVLANHHPVLNYVEALPPNIIPVGGLHIQPKPLPEDIKKILDDAKSGAILFSLGSNVRPEELGEDKIQAIINCFRRLKQTVIWKFQDNTVTNLPENVYIYKWLPQNDILGHPNTVLFITHGGMLSFHEIIYNGVPAIGIPFFVDQNMNVKNLVSKGIGERIDFNEITEEKLYSTIQKMLNDKSYANKVKRLSELYKDRQNQPLDTAIYWTEYILKHKTAAHLDLATRDMTLIEIFNIDLVLFILFLMTMLSVFVYSGIAFIFRIVAVIKKKTLNKVKSA